MFQLIIIASRTCIFARGVELRQIVESPQELQCPSCLASALHFVIVILIVQLIFHKVSFGLAHASHLVVAR